MKSPLIFDGHWEVALCELSFKEDSKAIGNNMDSTLFIYSNICKESVVNVGDYSLLRRIDKNVTVGWQYVFDFPFYLPVKKSEFHQLEFVIKTRNGNLASFLLSPLFIALHFKRYPFY